MKAAFVTSRPTVGQVADAIQVGELPVPSTETLAPNSIIIQVQAACINIDDIHAQQGSFLGGLPLLQAPTPTTDRPRVMGCDYAGVVFAIGSNVSNFQVGDAVCGLNVIPMLQQEGTWSEYVVSPGTNILPIAESSQWTFADWASLVVPSMVATAMVQEGDVTDTKPLRCLLVGASGGIGSILLQLLGKQKHHITAVCSAGKAEFVQQLGAEQVYDYNKDALTNQLKDNERFDRVFDLVGGKELEDEAMEFLLKPDGRYVTATGPVRWIGEDVLSAWERTKYVAHIAFWARLRNVLYRKRPTWHLASPMALTPDMMQHLVDANVQPVVERIVPFETQAVTDAIRHVAQHRAKGRVVIGIGADASKRAKSVGHDEQ